MEKRINTPNIAFFTIRTMELTIRQKNENWGKIAPKLTEWIDQQLENPTVQHHHNKTL